MIHPRVADLLAHLPFLEEQLDTDDLDLSTVVFGSTARLLIARRLSPEQEREVFAYFNALAERGDAVDLEILGTGAIELFNDSADAQRFARDQLTGHARVMLEQFREFWGQPDYGAVQ